MEDIDKMIQQSIKKAFQGAPISDPKEKNSAMRQTMQSMKETKKVKRNKYYIRSILFSFCFS